MVTDHPPAQSARLPEHEKDISKSDCAGTEVPIHGLLVSRDDINAILAVRELAAHLHRCGNDFQSGDKREAAKQALASVLKMLKRLDLPHEWRAPLSALLSQLMSLDEGKVGGLLAPNPERRQSRPQDGDPVWIARAALAGALEILHRSGLDLDKASRKVVSDFGQVEALQGKHRKQGTPQKWLLGQRYAFGKEGGCGPRDGRQMDAWNEFKRMSHEALLTTRPEARLKQLEAAYCKAIDTARHFARMA